MTKNSKTQQAILTRTKFLSTWSWQIVMVQQCLCLHYVH